MRTDTVIYMAVALSASLPLGAMGAFLWSERRWRERERWLQYRCKPSLGESCTSSIRVHEEPRTIPIRRRPFHEALWEDEPDLTPSPRVRAVAQELAARRRHDETECQRIVHELGAMAPGGLSVAREKMASRKPLPAERSSEPVNVQVDDNEIQPSSDVLNSAGHKDPHQRVALTLQACLSRLGFTDARGRQLANDGQYDPPTQAAVAAFQREQGLPATGLADAVTMKAVKRMLIANHC